MSKKREFDNGLVVELDDDESVVDVVERVAQLECENPGCAYDEFVPVEDEDG